AIKLLQFDDKDDLKNYLNEARAMTRLRHPHIVSLLDFGVSSDQKTPYLVMEYAEGGTLRGKHPKGAKLSLKIIATYTEQLASALQYVHDQRTIHRDLKPANVLLRADGTALLADFG